jgi:GRF zinc finger
MAANKVFNIAEINHMIFKNVENVKRFALINKCSCENAHYIMKLCSKIERYQEKIEGKNIELKLLLDVFLKYSGYKRVKNKSVRCLCKKLAIIRRVNRRNKNEGKLFYSCSKSKCNYLKWYNENLYVILKNRFRRNDLGHGFDLLKDFMDSDICHYEKRISKIKMRMWNLRYYNIPILYEKHYKSEILPKFVKREIVW